MTGLADNYPFTGNGFPAYVGTTAPLNPLLGQIWFNPTNGVTQVYTSTGWVTVNTSVNAQTINLNSPGGPTIGAAYLNWAVTPGNAITGSVVFATYGSPIKTYVLTNMGAPTTDAAWSVMTGVNGSFIYSGSGAPAANLGDHADLYINTANGDVYSKTTGSWVIITNMKGPQGETGATGPQGIQGPQGATGATGPQGPAGANGARWYSGSGAPPAGSYAVGDWYINEANGDIYEKTGASTWTLRDNITGPTGATGPQGPAGVTPTPGGSTGQVQYNNAGAWAGASGVTTNGTNLQVTGQGTIPPQTLTDGATINWNCNSGAKAKVTLAGNRAMAAVTNAIEGTSYTLWVIQDATGGRTLTWASTGAGSFDFGIDGPPSLSATRNFADMLGFEAVTIGGTLKLRFAGIKKGFT